MIPISSLKAKELLDKALKERMSMYWTTQYQLQQEKTVVGLPTLKDVDIQTIHEAFQVFLKITRFIPIS